MFCEGEWEQKRRFNRHTGIVGLGLIGHPDLARLTGLVGFIGLINFIGLICLISLDDFRLMSLIGLSASLACWLISLISHVNGFSLDGLKYVDHSIISLVGRIIDCNSLIGLISLLDFGVISFVGLICLISLVGLSLNGLIGRMASSA